MLKTYLYLIALSILPIFYKIAFWLYTIQLKNYRWDRFKEYIFTPQGKKAIFNFLFFIEIFVLALGILFFFGKIKAQYLYYSLVFLLQFESLFVFWKIFSLKIIVPKLTGRMKILIGIILIDLIIGFYWGYFHQNLMFYIIIPALLAFPYLYVAFWNFVTSGAFDFMKEKKYNQASKKLENYSKLNKIGITGSYGKSSMKEYLSTILEGKYKVIKTPENINTEIGIANFILNTDFSSYDYFVAEMGAYRKGEIRTCSNIVNQKDAFLTGLGNQHIGLFGGQQKLIDAKCEIGEKVLENNGKLYFNNSNIETLDDNIIHIKDKLGIIDFKGKTPEVIKKVLKNNQINFYGKDIKILKVDTNGTEFEVKNYIFKTKLIGKGQIENLVGAILFALDKGIKAEKIQKMIDKIKQPKNTMEIIKEIGEIDKMKNGKLVKEKIEIIKIDDTYNLSVNSLLNAVDIVSLFKGQKILVLDDILELGNKAENIHYKLGKYLADKFDKILFVGINYKKSFEKGIKENNGNLITKFDNNILENTVILLEGKKAKKLV